MAQHSKLLGFCLLFVMFNPWVSPGIPMSYVSSPCPVKFYFSLFVVYVDEKVIETKI